MVILLIATRNAHKAVEIRTILGERFHYLTLQNFPNAPETVEDAETFAGNATKKASGAPPLEANGLMASRSVPPAEPTRFASDRR